MTRPTFPLPRRGGRLISSLVAVAAGALVFTACTGETDPDRDSGSEGMTTTTATTATTVTALSSTVTAPATPTGPATGAGGDTRTVTVTTTSAPPPTTVTPTRSTTPTTPTTPTAPAVRPLGVPDLAAKQRPAPSPYGLMVSGVRVGSHDGFDRVVFDFAGRGTPGWYIDYTTAPTQQGSGEPVAYQGAVALQVGIDGTPYPSELGMTFPDHGTVTGSGNVTQVIYTSLFEGRTEFVIGVTDRLPYSVTVLENPPRLVIDIVNR